MATRGTGKTLQQIEKEELAKQMKPVNQAVATAEKANADYLTKYNATVDDQVATVTDRYQQDIDGADGKYQEQFDANAIAELVNQKKVEERMANMGLTDSGLNRTQQTALSVQRGNADAATRRSKLEYVQKLEIVINEAVAEGAAKKANKENELNASFAEWKNDLTLKAQQNAAESAQKLYNTQEATLDANYLAQLAAEQKKVTTRTGSNAQAQGAGGGGNGSTSTTAQKNPYEIAYAEGEGFGYTNNESAVYAKNGGGVAGHQAVAETAMQEAEDWVKRAKLDMDIAGIGTFFGNQNSDGKKVAQRIEEQLKGTNFQSLSKSVKSAILAFAVAEMVSTTWDKERDRKDNEARITKACQELGADKLVALALCGYSV